MAGKLIIFSAPSGCGKSTIKNYLIGSGMELHFSVSATTRSPREGEKHGVDYYYLSVEEFKAHIEAGDFVEYEEVYKDRFYGTLRSEVDDWMERGVNVLLDIDVNGALRVKEKYGDRALALFIQPPSVEELRRRLVNRGTETIEEIGKRVSRAEYEISKAPLFDTIVTNDDLATAQRETKERLETFFSAAGAVNP